MSSTDMVIRRLKQHEQGIYTRRELFPLLVAETPREQLADLKTILPLDIWTAFVEWVQAYPLEGGIQIRDCEDRPIEKIVALKQQVDPRTSS